MEGGRIQQVGPPDEIVSAPRTRFVAEYVSEPRMNFVSGTLSEREDGFSFESGDWQLKLDRELGIRRSAESVWLGVRPDAIVAEAGDAGRINGGIVPGSANSDRRSGAVVGCEEIAGVPYVHVKPHGREVLVPEGIPWVSTPAAGLTLRSGDEVWLRVDRNRVLLFDRQTGSNLLLGLEVTP
jgi:ABC-type sugar transport system ATPase subunit